MRPSWESGWRGRLYGLGRRLTPLSWRRAIRRRVETERLLGLRKPEIEAAWSALAPGSPRTDRDDVVVLPVIAWSYRRQRPQQLAEALARRGRRVFYGSVAGFGEPAEAVGAAAGVTLLPIAGPRREDLPERRLEGETLDWALESLAASRARFGISRATLLLQSPYWAPLAERLRERFGWQIVYDCLDAHEAFATNRAKPLVEAEKRLAAAADLVVATSEPLRVRMDALGARSALLPNACDYARFAFDHELEGRPSRRLSSKRPVTVGYVGAVDEWFDAELLNRLVALSPDWRFEIVGGQESGPAGLFPAPNLILHGERPFGEVKGFLSRFDVEIIPFKLTPLTHATDPVKVYEAAAAGLPVVTTPMESLQAMARQGVVRFASTPEEFRREILAATAEGPAGAERQRVFAHENTWDVRAAALDGWLAALPRRAAAAR